MSDDVVAAIIEVALMMPTDRILTPNEVRELLE